MELHWHFSERDTSRLATFVSSQSGKRLVLERQRRNVHRKGIDLSDASTWRVLVGCLATTQQPSGDNSKVARFLDSDSPVLDLKACSKTPNLAKSASRALSAAGLRRNVVIGEQLQLAIESFSGAAWRTLQLSLENLVSHTTLAKERESANLFRQTFKGIGPKQSRNLIQWIGLSRYVVPLDSRFTKHLTQIGFPIPVSASTLQDEAYYRFVEDGIQHISKAAAVYPCIYDACVFASFE